MIGTFDTNLTPFEPLARFVGAHSTGTWTLRIADGVAFNTGTLNSWSVQICGRPFEASTPEMKLRTVTKGPGKVVLDWWRYPGLTSYRVYRATNPSSASNFANVSSQDPDTSDTRFEDLSSAPILFWFVTGVGPVGEGPWGHFGQ